MINKVSMSKLSFIAMFLVVFSILIWEVTDAMHLVIIGNLVFIAILFMLSFLRFISFDGDFKKFKKMYSLPRLITENAENELYQRGKLWLNNISYQSSIAVVDDGVFIFRAFIFSAVIPWKYIKKIDVLNNYSARIFLEEKDENMSLVIPWAKEFQRKVDACKNDN